MQTLEEDGLIDQPRSERPVEMPDEPVTTTNPPPPIPPD